MPTFANSFQTLNIDVSFDPVCSQNGEIKNNHCIKNVVLILV